MGRRIGSKLYKDLFEFARSKGVDKIRCEYNIDPPNPASRAFQRQVLFGYLAGKYDDRETYSFLFVKPWSNYRMGLFEAKSIGLSGYLPTYCQANVLQLPHNKLMQPDATKLHR